MSPEPGDESLAHELAKLREADRANVPPFEGMWRARPKRLSPWWIAAPVTAVPVLVAAAVMILWVSRPLQEARPAAASAGPVAAQALDPEPLEFLLDSPVLGSAPDFDSNPLATTHP